MAKDLLALFFGSRAPALMLLLIVIGLPGCATWMDGTTQAGIDNARAASVDQSVGLGLALGQESRRFYMATKIADGYSARYSSQAYSLTSEIGYEQGNEVRAAAGLEATSLFLAKDKVPSTAGAGPTGQVLFRIHESDHETNRFYLGPRATAQLFADPIKNKVYVVTSLGLVFRWAFLDSTTETHPLPYCFFGGGRKRG